MHDPLHSQADAGPHILTVSQLNDAVKGLLGSLGRIAVEGEIAGLRRPASGHLYFNLKDRRKGIESVLGCAIWRSQVARATRRPLEEGMQVIAHGKLDVYAPRGTYSLIVDRVEPKGLGALLEQLEALKRELKALGWFDRARPLPPMPKKVGVVTSRDGAAFQDFLRTRSLRWAGYPVRLVHTPVQGPGAADQIAAALRDLDASGVDVIVVCRGGGSLEDLWCFNERVVAEAIHASSVPVVSGVGHETDLTLADLVADHRAHTPTDAAQTVIPLRRELEERCERQFNYLLAAADEAITRREERLERAALARVLRSPEWILGDRERGLTQAGARLTRAARAHVERGEASLTHAARTLRVLGPQRHIERDTSRVAALAERLERPVRERMRETEAQLLSAAKQLRAFSPYAVLGRGYSITRMADSAAPLKSIDGLAVGTRLETRLAEGSVESVVEGVSSSEPEGA
jgi:exodeoxyribonuclease VII large subunit